MSASVGFKIDVEMFGSFRMTYKITLNLFLLEFIDFLEEVGVANRKEQRFFFEQFENFSAP